MSDTRSTPKNGIPDGIESGGHPSIEVLDAYHHGRLPGKEESGVRRHLLLCPQCRGLLLDLARFLEDTGTPVRLTSAELTSAWEDWVMSRQEREG